MIAISAAGAFAEFFADKIAWVDSAWDAVHSFVRPVGGALADYRGLLAGQATRTAALVYLVLFLGIGLFVVFFPTWLGRELAFSSGQISLLYALGGTASVLVGPRAGRLSDRVGRKGVIVAASTGVGLYAIILIGGALAFGAYKYLQAQSEQQ